MPPSPPGAAGGGEPAGWGGTGTTAVVTPEAVALDLRTASIASRGLARALDLAIAIVGLTVILTLVGLTGSPVVIVVVASFLSFGLVFVYPAVFEWRWRGRTPGKAALGLRVVTEEGAPIGARQAIIRSVLGPVDLVAGVEAMLVSPRDRRLGDAVAGTIVLRLRTAGGGRAGAPAWFLPPPGCEAYTASLATAGMTSVDQAVVRSFVQRWSEFDGVARYHLAVALAGPIVRRLAHRVPAGMPPDVYLMCLAAARQRLEHPGAPGTPPGPVTGWGPPAAPEVPSHPAPPPPAPPPFDSAGASPSGPPPRPGVPPPA